MADPVLLDTHTLYWVVTGEGRLGVRARARAESALTANCLLISAFSFWEIAMLTVRQRIELYKPAGAWRQQVLESGVEEVPVSGEMGVLAAQLQGFHPDLADRIIVATAMLRSATLLTADERILTWSGSLLREDSRL